MTEQEAEAFGRKLERIWSCSSSTLTLKENALEFIGSITEDEELEFTCGGEFTDPSGYLYSLRRWQGDEPTGFCACCSKVGVVTSSHWSLHPERMKRYQQFTDQYLPLFRRNCWLSGLPIEASAHEKAEWIQGFSPEEVEAWNLSF